MPDENQLPRKEVLEGDELFVLAYHRIRTLLPGQANIRPKTFLQSRALMSRLHDASARAGDHHKTGFRNFAPELHTLLIFHSRGLGPRRTENRHLSRLRIRRE